MAATGMPACRKGALTNADMPPRYVLDLGNSEDWIALQVAMAPCLLGYGVLANQLYQDKSSRREGNLYWPWISNYVAEDYSQAVRTGRGEPMDGQRTAAEA